MKWLSRIVYTLCALVLLAGAGLFALPYVGDFEVKIVKSGSMEPTIHTGSVVVIHGKNAYGTDDVITFTSSGADIPTTHRIIGTEVVRGETKFVTKGDANEERDTELVSQSAVLGKVILSLPNLGYLLDFARQPIGFALLVGIPALLIIVDEIDKIWKEIRKRRRKNDDFDNESGVGGGGNGEAHRAELVSSLSLAPLVLLPFEAVRMERKHVDIRRRVTGVPQVGNMYRNERQSTGAYAVTVPLVIAFLISLGIVRLGMEGTTLAYMSDFEFSEMNTLVAQALGFTALPDKNSFTFLDGALEGSDGELVTLIAPEEGSVPMRYAVRVASTSGNPALCDAITANANEPFVYNGPLLGLATDNVTFDGSWAMTIGLNPGIYFPGDFCTVELTYHAWNADVETPLDGYDDEEKIQLTFNVAQPLDLVPFSAAIFDETVSVIVEEMPEETKTDDGNNGHGNDADGNDDSNPGNLNDPADTTDDEFQTDVEKGEEIPEETEDPTPNEHANERATENIPEEKVKEEKEEKQLKEESEEEEQDTSTKDVIPESIINPISETQ